MSEQSASPESGALSVEQAVAALTPAEPVEQQAPEAQAAPEPEETEGETSSPEEPATEAENPGDEEQETEAEPEAVAPVEPPKYWSQDAKAKFAELPPELQAVVLEQEGPREAATAKAKAEAAEISKQAQAEVGKVQQLAEALAERLPQWVQSFQDRWGTQTPDWLAYAQEHGAEAMTLAKTQFEVERQQLTEAAQAKELAAGQAYDAYVKAEVAKLKEVAPELATPEKGQAISAYLAKAGVPPEALRNISATEMVLAHKAMLWDEAQAKLSTAPKPKPAAPAPKAPVRPAAAVPAANPARTAINRFAQTRSVDDAVALLMASKGR